MDSALVPVRVVEKVIASVSDPLLYDSYIPLKIDYSDLFDIMAFFAGDLDGNNGHDDLAKQIADQGKEYTQQHWRYADMEACESRSGPMGEEVCAYDLFRLRLFPVGTRVGSRQL